MRPDLDGERTTESPAIRDRQDRDAGHATASEEARAEDARLARVLDVDDCACPDCLS